MAFLRLLSALILAIAPSVYAEDGGNSGGGGVFVELDVLSVRTFLHQNCEQFEAFKKHQVDCALFVKKIDDVGILGAGLSISDQSLSLDNGKAVDAINIKPAKVNIGATGWEGAGSDVPLKIGLQAHEFLSLMGLEHTGYYEISRDLVAELRISGRFTMLGSVGPTSLNWLRSHFENKGENYGVEFGGRDQLTGKECALFLTNKTYEKDEDYFVVVGYRKGDPTLYDYIGVTAVEAMSERSEAGIRFESTHPWGNITKYNNLKIQMNVFGRPLKATGKSDKNVIECVLDGTIVDSVPTPPSQN